MKVLFVCKYNAGRSQMAEAFFNGLSKKHQATSAGTHATERIHLPMPEFVLTSMNKLGFDLSKHFRKQLNPEMAEKADKIVMITEKENLPDYVKKSSKTIHWDVPDAKDKSYEFHCMVRDQIKVLVEKLVKGIG